jgi:hypothetical protein
MGIRKRLRNAAARHRRLGGVCPRPAAGGFAGASMEAPHDGQGPVTPARCMGTDRRIPQAGQ